MGPEIKLKKKKVGKTATIVKKQTRHNYRIRNNIGIENL
jgi:hypothetical protein